MGYRIPTSMSFPILSGNTTLVAGDTKYIGNNPQAMSTPPNFRKIYPTRPCKIIGFHYYTNGSNVPTTEDINLYIRKNDTTDYTLGTFNFDGVTNHTRFHNNNLNINLLDTDYIEIKLTTANPFVTPPANLYGGGYIHVILD